LNGGHDLVNDLRSPRFGKVGDAFDEGSGHVVSWLSCQIVCLGRNLRFGLVMAIIKDESYGGRIGL